MTGWDRRLVAGLLAIGVMLLVASGVSLGDPRRSVAVSGPEGSRVVSLEHDCMLTVDGALGEMVLVVEDGAVRVDRSLCAEQRCVHMPAITDRGGTIVCVPNGVTVTSASDGDDPEVDDVVR